MPQPGPDPHAQTDCSALACVFALVDSAVLMSRTRPRRRRRRARPKRPGVSTPGVRIPITKLKPDAVFERPRRPRLAGDRRARLGVEQAEEHRHAARSEDQHGRRRTIAVGKNPCSGLAAGFGSVWVPNCGDKTIDARRSEGRQGRGDAAVRRSPTPKAASPPAPAASG